MTPYACHDVAHRQADVPARTCWGGRDPLPFDEFAGAFPQAGRGAHASFSHPFTGGRKQGDRTQCTCQQKI